MKYQICVSGSAGGELVEKSGKLAYELGKAIAKSGHTLTTGATTGLPHLAAKGFMSVKNSKGVSAGFSPAASLREHVAVYRLPTLEFDYINFTGMSYVGRDLHLVRSSDAVITVGGRMGSLHELATALESKKICGILLGSGGLADYSQELFEKIWAPNLKNVIYGNSPDELVQAIIKKLDAEYADFEYYPDDRQVKSHERMG
jgi:uncharacterized protein (TIGR00725 family)